jgi:hypothetical protein|tara:strand:+ start:292 stop:519 length:228 start_codon:yes stop_codon:yes gene_type:complete
MTTDKEHKEAYRLFWMVKGHVGVSELTALSSANSYFKRIWQDGSDGAPLYEYEEGFEEAYNRRFHNGNFKNRGTI